MTKKVIYKMTRSESITVEVETSEQEELIKELNRDFERTDKREKRAKARCSSLEFLFESEGFELADQSPSAVERMYAKERRKEIKNAIHNAMEQLQPRQKEMILMVYFENKTQDEVAAFYGISKQAVSDAMRRIYKSLKRILEKNKKSFL